MVGAVIVRGGVVVGEGFHAEYGGDHAEVAALRAAGERARGATVYVTLEPCSHVGKTPPCADALIAAGVSRVVIAVRDPHPLAGGGLDRLARAGIVVTTGVEAARAFELNAPFFHVLQAERPWVSLKLALSIDGAHADAQGRSRWVTGERARRETHRLRAGHDAVVVGIGTALADDPSLTVRGVRAPRVPPRRVIFDRHARLPLDSQLVRSARKVPTIVVAESPDATRAAALEHAGVRVLTAASLPDALVGLRQMEIQSMLVEGGARLAGAFLANAVVDRLIIFRAAIVLGAGAPQGLACAPPVALADAPRFPLVELRRMGEDIMAVYDVSGHED